MHPNQSRIGLKHRWWGSATIPTNQTRVSLSSVGYSDSLIIQFLFIWSIVSFPSSSYLVCSIYCHEYSLLALLVFLSRTTVLDYHGFSCFCCCIQLILFTCPYVGQITSLRGKLVSWHNSMFCKSCACDSWQQKEQIKCSCSSNNLPCNYQNNYNLSLFLLPCACQCCKEYRMESF